MEMEAKYLVGTYARSLLVLGSGKGCKLYDVDKEYFDMAAGIATPWATANLTGSDGDGTGWHCHPCQERLYSIPQVSPSCPPPARSNAPFLRIERSRCRCTWQNGRKLEVSERVAAAYIGRAQGFLCISKGVGEALIQGG